MFRPNTYHRIYQHSTAAGFIGMHRTPGLHFIPPGVIKISHLRRSLSLQRKNLWKIRRLVKRMNAPQRGVAFKKMQSESKQSLSKTGKLRPDGRRSPGRTWWLWRRGCLFLTALIFLLRFCIKAKMKARPARTKESRMSTQTHRSYKKTFYPLRPNTYHRIYQHSTTAGFLGLHRIPGFHCIPPGVIDIPHLRRSLSLLQWRLCIFLIRCSLLFIPYFMLNIAWFFVIAPSHKYQDFIPAH